MTIVKCVSVNYLYNFGALGLSAIGSQFGPANDGLYTNKKSLQGGSLFVRCSNGTA